MKRIVTVVATQYEDMEDMENMCLRYEEDGRRRGRDEAEEEECRLCRIVRLIT